MLRASSKVSSMVTAWSGTATAGRHSTAIANLLLSLSPGHDCRDPRSPIKLGIDESDEDPPISSTLDESPSPDRRRRHCRRFSYAIGPLRLSSSDRLPPPTP